MEGQCVVFGCRNSAMLFQAKKNDWNFFNFPLSRPELMEKWLKKLDLEGWTPGPENVICGEHFSLDSFEMVNNKRTLKPEAIPNVIDDLQTTITNSESISGDAHEIQFITAVKVNMNRPQVLYNKLIEMYCYFSATGGCPNINRVLQIILLAMNTHIQEKAIQIAGSFWLYYIFREKNTNIVNSNIKKLVITSQLNAMTLYKNDDDIINCGCVVLNQFKMPQDFLFVYNELVELLIFIIMEKNDRSIEKRYSTYLMNSLIYQADDVQKETLGNLGIIQNLLKLINTRTENKVCDYILRNAWSTLWNVTDQTPVNCKRFLDNDGMISFTRCLEQFRQETKIMWNMMGPLLNIAEVEELRPRLMPYIRTFYKLVHSPANRIEVSYMAAGVISHIASDDVVAWQDVTIKRSEVLCKMITAIDTWDINSKPIIKYHSFEPILKLTRAWSTPQCQHWAISVLANFTGVHPEKYCPILEAENGLEYVRDLIHDSRPYKRIKELAKIVLANYEKFKDEELATQRQSEPMACDYDKVDIHQDKNTLNVPQGSIDILGNASMVERRARSAMIQQKARQKMYEILSNLEGRT